MGRRSGLRTIAAALATASMAAACSIAFVGEPSRVGPGFVVKVEGPAGPVGGISVSVRGLERVIEARTNAAGEAAFRGVGAGEAFVQAEYTGVYGAVPLMVREDGPRDQVIRLNWPLGETPTARALEGRLAGFGAIDVSVVNPFTGQKAASGQTDATGSFRLGPVADGYYVLELVASQLVVRVAREAAAAGFDLGLTFTSCGLATKDRTVAGAK